MPFNDRSVAARHRAPTPTAASGNGMESVRN